MRIIIRHMVPSFSSHLIAVLAETSLIFLGLGLREPAISWGACSCRAYRTSTPWPWHRLAFLSGLTIVVTVLHFNLVGDGLRDAAHPLRTVKLPPRYA